MYCNRILFRFIGIIFAASREFGKESWNITPNFNHDNSFNPGSDILLIFRFRS